MFHVLTITYLQPLDVVAETRPVHLEWVKAHVEAGNLLLAGRLESGDGAILITGEIGADAADEMTATDPYVLAGAARYDRTSFNATLRGAGL